MLRSNGSPRFLLLQRHIGFGTQGVFRCGVDLLGYLSRFASTSSWRYYATTRHVNVSAVLEILVHRVELHVVGVVSIGSPVTIILLLDRTLGAAEIRSGSRL